MIGLEAKLIILGVVAAAFAALAFAAHHYHNAYLVEHANFESFKGQVKALGDQAEAHRKEVEAKDKLAKEKADAENKRTNDTLRATIASMRVAANSGRGGLSAPAPAASSPERTCFDPAKLSAALQRLDQGILGLVESGSQAVADLDTAKRWAGSLGTQ